MRRSLFLWLRFNQEGIPKIAALQEARQLAVAALCSKRVAAAIRCWRHTLHQRQLMSRSLFVLLIQQAAFGMRTWVASYLQGLQMCLLKSHITTQLELRGQRRAWKHWQLWQGQSSQLATHHQTRSAMVVLVWKALRRGLASWLEYATCRWFLRYALAALACQGLRRAMNAWQRWASLALVRREKLEMLARLVAVLMRQQAAVGLRTWWACHLDGMRVRLLASSLATQLGARGMRWAWRRWKRATLVRKALHRGLASWLEHETGRWFLRYALSVLACQGLLRAMSRWVARARSRGRAKEQLRCGSEHMVRADQKRALKGWNERLLTAGDHPAHEILVPSLRDAAASSSTYTSTPNQTLPSALERNALIRPSSSAITSPSARDRAHPIHELDSPVWSIAAPLAASSDVNRDTPQRSEILQYLNQML